MNLSKNLVSSTGSSYYPFQTISYQGIESGNILLQNEEIPFVSFKTPARISDSIRDVFNIWNVPSPHSVLILRSDLCFLTEPYKTNLENKLVANIIQASLSVHRMWICTQGMNSGFSKTIGEAVKEQNIRKRMQDYEQRCDFRAAKSDVTLIGICEYDVLARATNIHFTMQEYFRLKSEASQSDQSGLQPHHTHFVFIKTDSTPSVQYDYLFSKFECALRDSQKLPYTEHKAVLDDAVCAACAIEETISMKNHLLIDPTPLFCLNIHITLLFRKYKSRLLWHYGGQPESDAEDTENLLKPALRRKIESCFPNLDDRLIDYLMDHILKCIWYSRKGNAEYLYILDVQSHANELDRLSTHMLSALFKSQQGTELDWHMQMKNDLLLTICWNCPDVAISKVFLSYPAFKVSSAIFQSVLLRKGSESFVSLFLDRGFKVHRFLSANQFFTILKESMHETFFCNIYWKGILRRKADEEVNDPFICEDFSASIKHLSKIPFEVTSEELNLNVLGIYSSHFDKVDDAVFAEQKALSVLIAWALVSDKLLLAKALWRHSGMPIMMALICSNILNGLSFYIKQGSVRARMHAYSKSYTEIAYGLLDKGCIDSSSRTWSLLSEENPVWGCYSIPDVAFISHNNILLSHDFTQKWVNRQFFARIRIREVAFGWVTFPGHVKVILSAIFVFPMYFWVGFQSIPDRSKTSVVGLSGDSPDDDTSQKNDGEMISKQLFSDSDQSKVKEHCFLWRMIRWMWTSPVTKFWTCYASYIFFLILYCAAVLWPSCGNRYLDLCVIIWMIAILLETTHCRYLSHRMYSPYIKLLKDIEISYMFLIILFYSYGRLYDLYFLPYATKVILSLGLLFFHYRATYMYLPISSTLGPLLFRIRELVFGDFVSYLYIVVFVMIGNGIVLQALIYPDLELNIETIRRSFYRAWITFFTVLSDDLEAKRIRCIPHQPVQSDCRVSTYIDVHCPYFSMVPYIVGLHYMILLKLVFWTLLFALVGNAHSQFDEKSIHQWKCFRYQLVVEYQNHKCLPPPFNLLCYFIDIMKCVQRCICHVARACTCRKKQNGDHKKLKNYSQAHCNYWKQVVTEYLLEQSNLEEESKFENEKLNMTSTYNEGLRYQTKTIYKAKSQIAELEADVSFTRLHVRTSKFWVKDEDDIHEISIHFLSRQSPYQGTKIDRYPVPNKYVPWEVKWLNYEPVMYTACAFDFPSNLRDFVDLNISMFRPSEENVREKQVFQWNMNYTDSGGICKRRRSWMLDCHGEPLIYLLHHGLPQNPIGRTGMSGKGSLFQWGPNHHVFVAITRFENYSTKGPLEFVAVKVKKNVLSLPGGFARTENLYMVIQMLFSAEWESKNDMIEFFQSCIEDVDGDVEEKVKCQMVLRGYMDDPLNTDNAWKELELWHIHYCVPTNIHKHFTSDFSWCMISGKQSFTQLPRGQSHLLKQIIRIMDVDI